MPSVLLLFLLTMEYEVIFSKRKTISLEIKDGTVLVRAPQNASKEFIKSFVEKHEDWIDKRLEKSKKQADIAAALSKEDIIRLKALARGVLTKKVAYYEYLMGVKAQKITITSARRRFGSCNAKNEICFSFYLMLYPEEAINYVVVHELAHIKHHDHSPAFHQFLQSFYPDEKEARKLLNSGNVRLPF